MWMLNNDNGCSLVCIINGMLHVRQMLLHDGKHLEISNPGLTRDFLKARVALSAIVLALVIKLLLCGPGV